MSVGQNLEIMTSYGVRIAWFASVLRVNSFQTFERLVELTALQQEFRALRESRQPQG